MKMKRHFAQFFVFAAIAFVSLTAFASNQRFIVVLDPHGKLTDKEVAAAGGTIEERFLDRWVVMLPSADTLRGNPGVKYVQPIGGSRDLTPLPDDIRTTSASRARIESTQTWGPMSYSYDAAGNIYAIGGDTYRYDLDSRLTQWTRSGDSSATETYGYDAYGNMTSYKRFDQSSAATISVDASTNHLTSDTYDHGNDISFGTTTPQTTVTYDSLAMPVQMGGASGTAYYVYTADDERIGVLTADTWNWSLRGFDHEVLRQFRSSNSDPTSPWLWVEDYVYRGSQLLAGERVAEEGGRRHFHLDHLGTPRLLTGSDGVAISQHDYTPFGLEYTVQNQELQAGFDREEPKRFTGHERDYLAYSDYGAAPDYMHARSYSSDSGRFLTLDQHSPNSDAPQSLDRYTYAASNPIRYIDPNGLEPLDPKLADFLRYVFGVDASDIDIEYQGDPNTPKGTMYGARAMGYGNTITISAEEQDSVMDLQPEGLATLAHEFYHTLDSRSYPGGQTMWGFAYLVETLQHGSGRNNAFEARAYQIDDRVLAALNSPQFRVILMKLQTGMALTDEELEQLYGILHFSAKNKTQTTPGRKK